jgi:RNA recognition motif-containing protein
VARAISPGVHFFDLRRINVNNKLYVGNLSYSTDEATLREVFSPAGNIRSITVMMDRMTNQPRGFAFVEMETPAEALKLVNGQEVDGRQLKVNEARPPEQRSNSSYGGGSRGNDRRSSGGNRRY